MNIKISHLAFLMSGLVIGALAAPYLGWETTESSGRRIPELKVDLSSNAGSSEVMIWRSIIPPKQANTSGLSMHRHNYSRLLIPLTPGTLQRVDADGSTTNYILEVGKPVPLTVDTADGFHTDENLGNKPIEVMVVQFNQAEAVSFSPLEDADLKTAISLQ